MAIVGDSWGIFSNPWVPLGVSPHHLHLKILNFTVLKLKWERIRTMWGKARGDRRCDSEEAARKQRQRLLCLYLDITGHGLDSPGPGRWIQLQRSEVAAVQTGSVLTA